MEHITNLTEQQDLLYELFEKISERNTFLLLGAGASVSQEKGFLAKTLIEFFQDKKHVDLGVADLKTFVDIVEAREDLSRDEFDQYVDVCLRKLKITDAHKNLASIPWRQIITTNVDLLVEQAYQEVDDSPDQCLRLKVVRGKKEQTYQCANDEVKLIKLNGCISSKKEFPLIFSSADFKSINSFYKSVLNELKNPSDVTRFISIGYSFSDPWSNYLFDIIDSIGFRENRFLYSVDPFVSDSILPLYSKKKICAIKCTFEEFIQHYRNWEETNNKKFIESKGIQFTTSNESSIFLNSRVLLRLNGTLTQLNSRTQSSKFTSKKEFYIGDEPNFQIINKNYDIEKKDKIKLVKKKIYSIIENRDSKILPIVFLTGSFGTGKSTFAYRLIKNIISDTHYGKNIAFEVHDANKLSIPDLTELFISSRAENIILYFNSIEINYIFKSLLEFRNKLSIEQYNQFNIIIITSIRENILIKNQLDKVITRSKIINVDTPLKTGECELLIRNLRDCGLLKYRDIQEEKSLIKRIQKDYSSDSFISLMELITNNHHIDDLLEAYKQIEDSAKEAFLYTSILYQYSIKMPASLLKNLISRNWQEFRDNVIEVDGKGILFQEVIKSNSTEPDIYFKTKHPLISKKLIEIILKPTAKYKYVQSIITHLIPGNTSSFIATSLLKAIKNNGDLNNIQLNRLYDLANENLGDSHHFILHYAINLQHRKNIKDLEKAENLLLYADSLVPYRNHMLIHRRAVINFELAKQWYIKEKKELIKTIRYLNEARELFEIKKIFDPNSSYSFYDLLRMEFWCLEKLKLDEEEELQARIRIEENFDVADRTVTDYKYHILTLKNVYKDKFVFKNNEKVYLDYLDDCYDKPELRPYALILLFNFYLHLHDYERCNVYLEELEIYKDINDVLKLLFKYYGRNLHLMSNRLKFFDLIHEFPEIEDSFSLRYNYFNFMAAAYNKHFPTASEYISKVYDRFNYLNPDFQLPWKETDTETIETFKGKIVKSNKGYKLLHVPTLAQKFYLIKKKNDYMIGKEYSARLFFYLSGIRAEIIEEI